MAGRVERDLLQGLAALGVPEYKLLRAAPVAHSRADDPPASGAGRTQPEHRRISATRRAELAERDASDRRLSAVRAERGLANLGRRQQSHPR